MNYTEAAVELIARIATWNFLMLENRKDFSHARNFNSLYSC